MAKLCIFMALETYEQPQKKVRRVLEGTRNLTPSISIILYGEISFSNWHMLVEYIPVSYRSIPVVTTRLILLYLCFLSPPMWNCMWWRNMFILIINILWKLHIFCTLRVLLYFFIVTFFNCIISYDSPGLSAKKDFVLSPGSSVSTGCEERDTMVTLASGVPFSFPSLYSSRSRSTGRCNTWYKRCRYIHWLANKN